MVGVDWVDSEEWAAIEIAFSAVEDRSVKPHFSDSLQSSAVVKCGADNQLPEAKRVCRQLPASWLDPPKYRAKSRLQRLVFRGKIVYCTTFQEVEDSVSELLEGIESLKKNGAAEIVLGFDIEWKPAFERGVAPGRAALVQLCLDSSRCYLFHIFHSGVPQALHDLLEEETICKSGVGIRGDAYKLKLDYSITLKPLMDLSSMANKRLSCWRNWSLSSLAEELTCKGIDKAADIRCGDWEAQPLSQAQQTYAATDAFASLHLFKVLASFPEPVLLPQESNSSQTPQS